MKDFLLGFGKFFHEGGANLAPADSQYYSNTGLPAADRALMRGAQLCVADENKEMEMNEDEDEDITTACKYESDDDDEMIHGKPRRPSNIDAGGICRRPVRMDDAGRVDLQHDPYCLRKHFTTQWGVLTDKSVAWKPGATVEWTDWEWTLKTEGEGAGLWVDLNQTSHVRRANVKGTRLIDLISTPLLLYRIIANFAAPPCTEEDGYKCAWSFTLWKRDDRTCRLEICDHKGSPQANFRGKERASTEALQLLEWLTGNNCPHPYDYTPCGRHA